ncbi:MAG: hypothetical protein JO308_19225 [Verrucomicrobia bacterium]|nr:hypothetical protein [Verrucomicrobiota bacterium]
MLFSRATLPVRYACVFTALSYAQVFVMPSPLELDAMIDDANDWIQNSRQFVSRVTDPDVTNVLLKVYKILELQNVALAKISELIKG